MKKLDIDAQIRALRVPQKEDDYWKTFPGRVLVEADRRPVSRLERRHEAPGMFWLGRVALACFAVGFAACQAHVPQAMDKAWQKDEKQLHQAVIRFEKNLSQVMQDEHGLHRLIEDQS